MAKKVYKMIDNSKSVAISEEGKLQTLGMTNLSKEYNMIINCKVFLPIFGGLNHPVMQQ